MFVAQNKIEWKKFAWGISGISVSDLFFDLSQNSKTSTNQKLKEEVWVL